MTYARDMSGPEPYEAPRGVPMPVSGVEESRRQPDVESSPLMIATSGLQKSFKRRQGNKTKQTVEAVRGIDLSVRRCEIFGFLGPNGAGKTTTLRMLTTAIAPDAGDAVIAGADLRRAPRDVRRRIGCVPQTGGTWYESTAREELLLQARMYGIRKAEAKRRVDSALETFELKEYADRPCKTYSGGQRRRVEVALGIVHGPQVLFLDEPTAGLDPQSRAHMWETIRRLRAGGMTIFVTTHYLEEADSLCDRVAIIDRGKIVAEGTPAELKQSLSGEVVALTINRAADASSAAKDAEKDGAQSGIARAKDILAAQSCAHGAEIIAGKLRVRVDVGAKAIPAIVRALDGAQIVLDSIEILRPSLDDAFLAKTGRSLRQS